MRRTIPLLAVLAACAPPTTCDLRSEAVDLAGAGAEDCGQTVADADPTAVQACLAAAFTEGRDAFGIVAVTGIDSVISTATVLVDGAVWLLTADNFMGQVGTIDGWGCEGPTLDDDGVLECASLTPRNNHYLVCGTWPGGDQEPEPFPPDA